MHVHHVYAGDEQNENDRGKHSPNLLTQLRTSHRIQKRLHARRGECGVRLRIVLRQMAGKTNELRVHLIDAHTRLEPANHRRCGIVGPDQQLTARFWRKLIVKRNPELFGDRKFEIRRHDADDRGSLAINPNTLSDDVAVAVEIALPDFVTEDSDLFRAGLVVLGREIAAHNR